MCDDLGIGQDGFSRVNPNPTCLDMGQISLTCYRPIYNVGWVTWVKSGSDLVGLWGVEGSITQCSNMESIGTTKDNGLCVACTGWGYFGDG